MTNLARRSLLILAISLFGTACSIEIDPGNVGLLVDQRSDERELTAEDVVTGKGVDNLPGATPLPDFEWPEKPLLVFGHENGGLDFLPNLAYSCKHLVFIPQIGSCRSLNVAVASGITTFDLASKKGWLR